MQPQLCNNFRYSVFPFFFLPSFLKNSSFLLHWTESDSLILFFKWSNFIQHIGILGFVLFVRKGRNQEQMLSHTECAGWFLCLLQLLSIFFIEKKKNEIKMLFLLPSVFRDLKRTCPSCTGIHCTVQTILLLCVWFQTKFFLLIRPFPPFFCSTVALVLFAPVGEKDQWNVCWTTQQIHFLGPILFVYRFFFEPVPNKFVEKLPWQPTRRLVCQGLITERKKLHPFP